MKYYLLSASLIALLSSESFASRQQAQQLADNESNQQALMRKLEQSPYGTINLDEEVLSNTIKNYVRDMNHVGDGQIEGSNVSSPELKSEAKSKIRTNIDLAKNSEAFFSDNERKLTHNYKQKYFSLGFKTKNPLVYPANKSWRDDPDAFLPKDYGSPYTGASPISKVLWQEIETYANGRGLSVPEAKRLYHYLEPLFYITQTEVGELVNGLHNKWCWTKGDRSDMVAVLKTKTDHHLDMISNSQVVGLQGDQNRNAVKNWLVPRLLDKSLAMLPDPLKDIYKVGNSVYKLGVNYHNKISMIHPITELPYPIFKEDRGQPDWNLPQDYQPSVVLNKQWDRVHHFVRLHDGIKTEEQSRIIKLLEPVGYFFHKQLENFHVRGGDLPDPEMGTDRIIFMARMFADIHTIFQPYLDIFYDGNVDVHSALHNVQDKNESHVILTANLWPQRLVDHKKGLADGLLNYLMFKDIVDRFKVFYPDKVRELDRMSVALN